MLVSAFTVAVPPARAVNHWQHVLALISEHKESSRLRASASFPHEVIY